MRKIKQKTIEVKRKDRAKGFTLIELLIVISIISVLLAILVISPRSTSHDQKLNDTKARLETLKTAIERYHSKYGTYPDPDPNPANAPLKKLVDSGILRSLPKDPFSAGKDFKYIKGYEYASVAVTDAGGAVWQTRGGEVVPALPSGADNADLRWLKMYYIVYSVGANGTEDPPYWDWPEDPASDPARTGLHQAKTAGDDIYIYGTAAAPKIPDRLREASQLIVGSFGIGYVYDMQIQGDLAYLAAENALVMVDISTPYAPTVVSTFTGNASAVAVSGRYAYTGSGHFLNVIDVSNPASPTLAFSLDISPDGGFYDICDVFASENYAYVLTTDRLLIINVDLTSPGGGTPGPSYVGDTGSGSISADLIPHVYVRGKYAYVAAYRSDSLLSRLKIWDVSNAAAPGLPIYDDNIGADEFEIVVTGRYAYLADGEFNVLDVSDPRSPSVLRSVTTPGWLRYIAVSGHYAYTADDQRLRVYDIANPILPFEVPNNLPNYLNYINCLAVKDNYAFLDIDFDTDKLVVIQLF